MTARRGARGSKDQVEAARRQAREALGRDDTLGPFDAPKSAVMPRYVEPQPPPERRPSEAIGVLTLGEAAARLGVTRAQLEAMIAAGKIEALPTGYTRMIPTSEVDRLARLP